MEVFIGLQSSLCGWAMYENIKIAPYHSNKQEFWWKFIFLHLKRCKKDGGPRGLGGSKMGAVGAGAVKRERREGECVCIKIIMNIIIN